MVSLNQTGESKKSGNAKSRRQGTVTHTPMSYDKNVYRIRYSLPTEKNSKQKRVAETVRGTKKEAEKILRKRLASVDSGLYVNKHKETVSEFMSRWMETYAATNVTLRTAHGYEGYIHRYIDPTIGKVALQSLTPSQIVKGGEKLYRQGGEKLYH